MGVLQPAAAATLALVLPKLQRWWRRRLWRQEQDRLATLVSFDDAPAVAALVSRLDASEPCVVAGVALVEDRRRAVAVAIAIELPSMKRIDGAVVPVATSLPYEPGYVGFRAAPFLARALGAASGCERGPRARPRLPPPAQIWRGVPRGPGRRRADLRRRRLLLRVDGVDEAAVVSRARASLRSAKPSRSSAPRACVWGAALRATLKPISGRRTCRPGPASRWRRPSDWPSRADGTACPSPFGSRSSRDAWRCASVLTSVFVKACC